MPHKLVPVDFWRTACEVIHHPVACVAPDNHFMWCNAAWERLVGYSLTELRQMTWMDITVHEDVGGDLASVNDVLDGVVNKYTMTKKYIHKSNYEIPIVLSVWRFPLNTGTIMCFVVEAVPETASAQQLEKVQTQLEASLIELQKRISAMEDDQAPRESSNTSGVSVSVGNNSNSSDVFKWVVIALVALIGAVSYVAYIAGWPSHNGDAKPPTINVPSDLE